LDIKLNIFMKFKRIRLMILNKENPKKSVKKGSKTTFRTEKRTVMWIFFIYNPAFLAVKNTNLILKH